VGRQDIGKKGVVKDPVLHRRVLEEVKTFCRDIPLDVLGQCESPILGPAGNKEFFIHLKTPERDA
jgi:23S rRNA (cytidine1920-2'-O)/16S rRNA (cytidine1409-2'-O)-methyltransferase